MGKKNTLYRGLAVLFSFAFTLSCAAGNIAEGYKATIDTALGTHSEEFRSESSEDDPLYNKYTPSAEVLNEDGTGNSKALIQKAIELNRSQAAEGSVLLKNEGNALPLSRGANVTLFGIRSHCSLLGSSFGVTARGPFISLEQALSSNKTDFANNIATTMQQNYKTGEVSKQSTASGWSGDEFEFEGAGFNINPTMVEIYDKLNVTYDHAHNEPATSNYDPGEPSLSEISGVNGSYKDSFSQYGDAAIVVVSRPSAESLDYLPGSVAEGTGASEPLELTKNERDAIALAKECSEKVIVLINSSNAMEIAELKNDPEIDAILWIGFPGCYGMLGVADILCGRTSPSGGLADIFAAKNMSAPAMQNMGNITYGNAEEVITRSKSNTYVIEAEGIYVGYRYYETRYYDSVKGQGNADSSTGAYASQGGWNYDDEVVYGFGYGLSYTTFDMEIQGEPEWDITPGQNHAYATFNVKVTNTGTAAGKTPVQIYGQAPYTAGGIEKPAIQLLDFGKTALLQPGESETVPVKVDLQFIASYDQSFQNSDGTTGTYVLEPGDYYFAVGNGAHDALNNIMAAQGIESEKMVGTGDAKKAYMKNINEEFISKTAFSTSKTGYQISNRLPYSDWNYYQPGEVTYLSRADWSGTWPKNYSGMTLTSQELIDDLNGKYYTIKTDDDTSAIKWEQDSDLMFYEMAGSEFDDPRWTELLDKISLEEAQYLATFGGPPIPGVSSIGTVETYMAENAGNGVNVALNASKDTNAPWAIPASDPNGNWNPEVFACAPLVAASFNNDLYKAVGEFVGEESLFVGIPILWGPGLNTHRHAYNGRNGEYYSEDPVLSGYAAMEFAIGALNYGLVAAPKHFAFNDQETNRAGVAPYLTEQRAREIELRAYQIAFEATKYDTPESDAGMRGLMISFSKIGGVECTTSYGLMTEILKKEWGFKGYAVTDIYDDTDLYGAVLASGATCFDTRGVSGFYGNVTLDNSSTFASQNDGTHVSSTLLEGDATLQAAVKESAHNVLYAMSRSNLTNRYNSTTRIVQTVTWWRVLYVSLIVVFGIAALGCLVLYQISGGKGGNKEGK